MVYLLLIRVVQRWFPSSIFRLMITLWPKYWGYACIVGCTSYGHSKSFSFFQWSGRFTNEIDQAVKLIEMFDIFNYKEFRINDGKLILKNSWNPHRPPVPVTDFYHNTWQKSATDGTIFFRIKTYIKSGRYHWTCLLIKCETAQFIFLNEKSDITINIFLLKHD